MPALQSSRLKPSPDWRGVDTPVSFPVLPGGVLGAKGPFLVIHPTSHEAHLDPHEWEWTEGSEPALPLFDLLERLTPALAA